MDGNRAALPGFGNFHESHETKEPSARVTIPPQPLTAKDVAKVGLLARLALSESDLERMTGELSKIVGFVSMLGELDTADVAPLAHPLDTQNVFRDDLPAALHGRGPAVGAATRRRMFPRAGRAGRLGSGVAADRSA